MTLSAISSGSEAIGAFSTSTAEARNDEAVEKLEFLLSVPGEISIPLLRVEPPVTSRRVFARP